MSVTNSNQFALIDPRQEKKPVQFIVSSNDGLKNIIKAIDLPPNYVPVIS